MKTPKRKPLTTNRKALVYSFAIVMCGIIAFVLYDASIHYPSWKYVQSFQHNSLLTSVEQTGWQGKNTRRDFFRIHCFDFRTNEFLAPFEVSIRKDGSSQSEYVGFSERYIWLKTPELTAVDMRSPKRTILRYADLSQRIRQHNPAAFKEVIGLSVVEGYLKATNQDGDEYFVNVTTFATTQQRPMPYYDAWHADYTITPQLPLTADPTSSFTVPYYVFHADKMIYMLYPVSDDNQVQFTFHCMPEEEQRPPTIVVSTTDSTQVLVTSGDSIVPVKQVMCISDMVQFERMTPRTFVNAVGIGIRNRSFVFYYQKKAVPSAPWFLAWFDLDRKTISKEIDLSQKGLAYRKATDYLSHRVAMDGSYVYFFMGIYPPMRIAI